MTHRHPNTRRRRAAHPHELATESTAAFLRSIDAMTRIQQHAIEQSLQRRRGKLALGGPFDPLRFAFMQADLMRQDVEAAGICCKEITEAALAAHGEITACLARLPEAEAFVQAAHALD